MNKDELITALASKTGNTKVETTKYLDALMATVSEALAKKEEINLIGFGKFYTIDRPAKKGKNPRTGETIDIPATTSPKFKAGKGLKYRVNK